MDRKDHPRLLLVLVPVAVLLVGTSLVLTLTALSSTTEPFPGFDRLLAESQVDREATVPSWFSSCLLLLSALLLLDTAVAAWRTRDRWRWHWSVLAAAFAYLSVDESAGLHEHATPILNSLGVETSRTTGWLLVALPLTAVFALLMAPFLLGLPRRTAVGLVATGALYVGGAAGMEVVGTLAVEAAGGGGDNVPYVLASHAEELLEMVAVALFARTVADHRRRHLTDVAPADSGEGRASGEGGTTTAPAAAVGDHATAGRGTR